MTPLKTGHLFVYGTLRQAFQNPAAQHLHNSADHIGQARVRGRLYRIARYPGFLPSQSENDWVHGDVYHLHSPELTYTELDKYEGCSPDDPPPHEYRRATITVLLDSGAWLEACVYIYALEITGKQRIMSGDYCASE